MEMNLQQLAIQPDGRRWSVVMRFSRVGIGPEALAAVGVDPVKTSGLTEQTARKVALALDPIFEKTVRRAENKGRK